jgi:N-acetyl-anhydromuramyl-L-alanine amidase AmpD
MKVVDNKLIQEVGDKISINLFGSPNVIETVQKSHSTIVIHAPDGRSLAGAHAGFMSTPSQKNRVGRSVHLVVDEDGSRIEQFVRFNKVANHALGFNSTSLGIELVYGGRLIKDESKPGFHLRKWFKEEFQGNQYIYASALNDASFHYWPLFPKSQLDTLYQVAKVIKNEYQVTNILGYEELNPVLHPGPAFPITQFREKLFGVTEHSIVLQETLRNVLLLGEPGKEQTLLSDVTVPSGAPVSIINEISVPKKGKWYLISVIDTEEGSPWLMGWVEADAVKVNTVFQAVVNAHEYLTTREGRRFQEIRPHPNGYDTKRPLSGPKYIIMHFTTGTKIESTISHFKNPSAGVSTHLLIGRDGRVVQFLPFNKIAYHSGYSWWERESNLNTSSIGIELDNAGLLRKDRSGKWFRRKIEIPARDVKQKIHWKQYKPKDKERYPGWEKFPQIQLDVALSIVQALKEKYPSIEEILGHDDVNLRNRYDPGPLFPMKDFREKVFKRRNPEIQIYKMIQEIDLYGNFKGRLPNTKQRTFDAILPANSQVRVMLEEDDFSLVALVRTKNPKLKGIGWIQTSSMESAADRGLKGGKKQGKGGKKKLVDTRITKIPQPVYKQGEGSPTPVLWEGPFKKGTKVRIQQVRGAWTLVVVLDRVGGRGGLEGWLPTEYLTPEVD